MLQPASGHCLLDSRVLLARLLGPRLGSYPLLTHDFDRGLAAPLKWGWTCMRGMGGLHCEAAACTRAFCIYGRFQLVVGDFASICALAPPHTGLQPYAVMAPASDSGGYADESFFRAATAGVAWEGQHLLRRPGGVAMWLIPPQKRCND